jgi:phosphoribosylglycinamide formyltransferase-1
MQASPNDRGRAGSPLPQEEEALLRLAVLASGSGTNLEAIARACERREIPARIVLVAGDVSDAYALQRARDHGIPAVHLDRSSFPSRRDYDLALVELLREHRAELVVLAGYMLLVGPEVVEAFRGRIMNIHPALLPSFPGTHGVADALAYGVKVTGVTVHFVDEGLDTGPIILQEAVRVEEGDDVETLHQRIHQVEYRIYKEAIRLYAEGRLSLEGRRVRIKPG